MGAYGVPYRIYSLQDLKKLDGHILLTASSPSIDENVWVELGKLKRMWGVFHDPNEFKVYTHWKHLSESRVVCIRENGLRLMHEAEFIPHPYIRENTNNSRDAKVKNLAISVARTSPVKNSQMIMEANRSLPRVLRVKLLGEPHRVWFKHFVEKKYPEYVGITGYSRDPGTAVALCANAMLMVDLTVFINDGGGTQYSILEAMDAGALPIMHTHWTMYPGKARRFGPSVLSVEALVRLLKSWKTLPLAEARQRNWKYLDTVHAPDNVRAQYIDTIRG